jgi:hypothetical protein
MNRIMAAKNRKSRAGFNLREGSAEKTKGE